jgi:hypothetical protein
VFLAPGLLGGFGLMAGEINIGVNKNPKTIKEPSTGAAPPTTSPERSQGGVQQIPGEAQQQNTDMCNGLATSMGLPMMLADTKSRGKQIFCITGVC